MMPLERMFGRLSIRSPKVCHHCRRSTSTSSSFTPFQPEERGARSAFATPPPPDRRTATGLSSQNSAGSLSAPPAMEAARQIFRTPEARRHSEEQRAVEAQRTVRRTDLEQQSVRRWRPGDVYAPHDLSGAEQSKWKKIRQRPRPKYDVMDQLGINPLHHYKNFSMMSEYMTEMGRIKHSKNTGLRPVNQRRMAKAIRRAIGMGLMPGVHRHPEILKRSRELRGSLR